MRWFVCWFVHTTHSSARKGVLGRSLARADSTIAKRKRFDNTGNITKLRRNIAGNKHNGIQITQRHHRHNIGRVCAQILGLQDLDPRRVGKVKFAQRTNID